MKEVLYFFECTVVYRSVYESEISMGNTSTGGLEVDFLGKSGRNLRRLINAGYEVFPVVILGSDLLGRICMEYLKKMGCLTDYIGQDSGETNFVFVLEVKGKRRAIYKYIREMSGKQCAQYRHYYKEALGRRQCSALFAEDMTWILGDQQNKAQCMGREGRRLYTLTGTERLTALGSGEEINRLEEVLRKE